VGLLVRKGVRPRDGGARPLPFLHFQMRLDAWWARRGADVFLETPVRRRACHDDGAVGGDLRISQFNLFGNW